MMGYKKGFKKNCKVNKMLKEDVKRALDSTKR